MAGSEVSREYVEATLNSAIQLMQGIVEEPEPIPMAMIANSNDDDKEEKDGELDRKVDTSTSGDTCDSHHPSLDPSIFDARGGDCAPTPPNFMNDRPGPLANDRLVYAIRLLDVVKLAVDSLPPGYRFPIVP